MCLWRSRSIGYYHQHTLSKQYGNDSNYFTTNAGQMVGWTDGWMDGQRKLTEDVTKKETAEWKQMEIFIFKSGVEVEHILYFKFN